MSGIYDATLSVGGSQTFNVLGGLVKVVSAPAIGGVTVRLDGGESYSLLEGQGVRLPAGKTFRDVNVKNSSTATQTVLLYIGDSNFEDTRITGNVRIIDSGADKTSMLRQFFTGIQGVPVAGVMSWSGVLALAGKVAIKRLQVNSATAGALTWGTGPLSGTLYTAATKLAFSNKYIGSAVSTVAQVLANGQTAAYPPTAGENPGFVQRGIIYVAANTPAEFPLTTPIILDTNVMLAICSNALNRDVSVTADVEEIS